MQIQTDTYIQKRTNQTQKMVHYTCVTSWLNINMLSNRKSHTLPCPVFPTYTNTQILIKYTFCVHIDEQV